MKSVKIATHDGIFHADEVFALAVMKLWFEKENIQIEIVRTRNLEKIALCDIAVDVGSEYSLEKNRFDHHQKNGPAGRDNGIPHASFGLIWKHFGKKISRNKKVREIVERRLVMPIDAMDNGVSVSAPIYDGVYEFGATQFMHAIGAAYSDEDANKAFEKAVEIASLVITGEISKAKAKVEGEIIVTREIQSQGHPKVLVLQSYVSWDDAVRNYKNIMFVIFPGKETERWCIQTVRDNAEIFGKDRISFSTEWRGLSDDKLAEVVGIPDSVFCHTGGFFAVTKSKDSAIEMAHKALAYNNS